MSIVVSAALGAGKSLYCMSEIDRISKKQPNRHIYTNIIGCSYPGVIAIQSTTEKPFDWRDLPNGSVLVYDEAHEHPAFCKDDLLTTLEIDDEPYFKRIDAINSCENLKVKEKEEFIRRVKKEQSRALVKAKEDILDIGRSLTLHRHFGIDIYLITQKPERLNAAVRASVTKHLVLRRLFNLKASTIYEYIELQDQFGYSTIKNSLSWKFWRFPKQLYKFYISAEEHPQTVKVPFGLWGWAAVAIALLGYASFNVYNKGFYGIGGKKQETQQVSASQSHSKSASNQSASNQSVDPNFDVNVECRKAENMNSDVCKKWLADLSSKSKSLPSMDNPSSPQTQNSTSLVQANQVSYNPDKPFDDENIRSNIHYDVVNKPRFAGCIKYNGRYFAYTEQGTRLKVSQSDCQKVMSGDRPYDYFTARQNASVSSSVPASAFSNSSSDSQVQTETKQKNSQVFRIPNNPTFKETDITKPSI